MHSADVAAKERPWAVDCAAGRKGVRIHKLGSSQEWTGGDRRHKAQQRGVLGREILQQAAEARGLRKWGAKYNPGEG